VVSDPRPGGRRGRLDYLADRAGDPCAADRRQEASDAREAALRLRGYASAAQRRLDPLDAASG
jgi:hypothetical protein